MKKSEFKPSKDQLEMTPGDMLRTIRDIQGLSQKELAELCGYSQSNISSLENGATQIGRERALVLARALKVHPAVLLFPNFNMNEIAS